MRLAFDKPAIIIIDEKTGYSFDTSPIEHISYRSDMRYHDTIDFIKKLAEKIAATHKKSIEDKDYSPFLKEFRRYKVADLKEENVSIKEYLDRRLDSLQKSVERSNSKLSSFKIGDNWDSGKSWTDVFHMSPSAESKVLVDTINKIFDTGNYTSEDEAYKSAIRILPLFGVDVNQRHVQELIRKQMDDHIFF